MKRQKVCEPGLDRAEDTPFLGGRKADTRLPAVTFSSICSKSTLCAAVANAYRVKKSEEELAIAHIQRQGQPNE